MLARGVFAVLLLASCAKSPTGSLAVDGSVPPPTRSPPRASSAVPAPEPEATAVRTAEPEATAIRAPQSPPSASAARNVPSGPLALALAGRPGTLGIFWIPNGDVPGMDDDLLLEPDGTFTTHLHQHPGSSGDWSLEGDVLTLQGSAGDPPLVIRSLRIRGNLLRGIGDDGPISMTKVVVGHSPGR
jgi:hypothetical protein